MLKGLAVYIILNKWNQETLLKLNFCLLPKISNKVITSLSIIVYYKCFFSNNIIMMSCMLLASILMLNFIFSKTVLTIYIRLA